MADELDDLVGAVAEDDILAGDTEALGDRAAQLVTAAIRIEV